MSVQIEVADDSGEAIAFEVPDSLASRWTCSAILRGETYPHLPVLPQGECLYVRRDLVDLPGAVPRLRELVFGRDGGR